MTARRILGITLLAIGGVVLVVIGVVAYLYYESVTHEPLAVAYVENCSACHGEHMEGTGLGTPLVGVEFVHGETVEEIGASIANGFPARGMPGWADILPETEIRKLAIYISERRSDLGRDFRVGMALEIPEGTVRSELHDFRIETFAEGLDPLPYSISPLPDGRFLVTEKKRGLRLVSADGEPSPLVEGTPAAHADAFTVPLVALEFGTGWMMEVAAHPDYADNGWVYLHFGDRCDDCNAVDGPVSMNKVVRGRIDDGRWVDEETVWSAPVEDYSAMPDMAAGGRLCFDDARRLYISVGMKGPVNYYGIQDLGEPYGKIHRVHDDGSVPADNPFLDDAEAQPTAWTYGHRSPQGLECDHRTGRVWSTEMGPRGGDEINLLLPGRNYGWPLTSKGVDYDGTPVEYGKELGITFDLADIEQPVVDLTPSPAVSSFVFYEGDAFPAWRNQMLVGTLKATELYRVELDGDRLVHRETLITDLARIRDVEVGADGLVYLLLEHASGGRIVRLAPAGAG